MQLDLLTPTAAFVGLAVALPFLALALAARRGGRARRVLGLGPAGSRPYAGPAFALVALGGLVAVAVSQPVLQSRDAVDVRVDAAAYVAVDTSRSMLAAASPTAEPRLVRARRAALRIREELSDVPVGIISLSDRALPHLFPSPDREAFAGTLARAIRVGHPEPSGGGPSGTNLTALAGVATENFFTPDIRHRLVFVITDGESAPVDDAAIAHAFATQPKPTLLLVQVGNGGEQVFDARGRPERGYAAAQLGPPVTEAIASITGARLFDEHEAAVAARHALAAIGATGPTERRDRGVDRRPLGAWALAVAAVPLAYLLRRRNADR